MTKEEFDNIKQTTIFELSSLFPLNYRVQHIITRLKRLQPPSPPTCVTCNHVTTSDCLSSSCDSPNSPLSGVLLNDKDMKILTCICHTDYEVK